MVPQVISLSHTRKGTINIHEPHELRTDGPQFPRINLKQLTKQTDRSMDEVVTSTYNRLKLGTKMKLKGVFEKRLGEKGR